MNQRSAPLSWRLWILSCALLSAGGWLLSAVGQLNQFGYLVLAAPSIGILWLAVRRGSASRTRHCRRSAWPRLRSRFRRPLPMAFLVLSVLAIAGGVLYAPSNWDALAFRTPRVLHWLTEGRWHWMTDARGGLNTRTCAFEWVTAPLILFSKTDRWLFLLNAFSFLLLPGLVFSLFRRLGISRRAAWHWMWVFPTGLCFVIQAGSLANDIFGVVFALAALDFALRARAGENSGANFRYSVLSAALMTGAKLSNMLLGLPWLLALVPTITGWWRPVSDPTAHPRENALPKLIRQAPLNLAALALALLASFVPTAWLNYRHSGDWTGAAAEIIWTKPPNPGVCFVHDTALLTVQNLVPPVFPMASAWDRFIQRQLPETWKKTLDDFAEEGRNSYRVRELPMEEHSGLGLGLALLVGAQLVLGFRRDFWKRIRDGLRSPQGKWWAAVLISPYLSLGIFMCKSGLVAISRIIAPFYGLLLPLLLVISDSGRAARTRWWRALAWLSFAFAFIAVVATPARPLVPAESIFQWCRHAFNSPLFERAATVYSVYGQRHDVLAPVRQMIPESAKVIGLVTLATPEASLWRPFGQRRVVRLSQQTSADQAHALGVEYVVVETDAAVRVLGQPVEKWAQAMNGTVLTNIPVRLLASQPPIKFTLVRLDF